LLAALASACTKSPRRSAKVAGQVYPALDTNLKRHILRSSFAADHGWHAFNAKWKSSPAELNAASRQPSRCGPDSVHEGRNGFPVAATCWCSWCSDGGCRTTDVPKPPHNKVTAVRSTEWVGDFSRLDSTTWRWWPRFVPDGTGWPTGSKKRKDCRRRRRVGRAMANPFIVSGLSSSGTRSTSGEPAAVCQIAAGSSHRTISATVHLEMRWRIDRRSSTPGSPVGLGAIAPRNPAVRSVNTPCREAHYPGNDADLSRELSSEVADVLEANRPRHVPHGPSRRHEQALCKLDAARQRVLMRCETGRRFEAPCEMKRAEPGHLREFGETQLSRQAGLDVIGHAADRSSTQLPWCTRASGLAMLQRDEPLDKPARAG
jgi:hypothetical protein